MKIVFFGNHDVGIVALKALISCSQVVGVVAHPLSSEERVRYSSVYDFAIHNGLNVIRGSANDCTVTEFVEKLSPDLIWVTDYKYLLPQRILRIPCLGAVNLHPSLLPRYRGRASINWAIINGERQIGLTAHFIDEGVDSGDIITQSSIILGPNETVGDALSMLKVKYHEITKHVLALFDGDAVPRVKQDVRNSTIYPARSPADGRISWGQSSEMIHNLVRALAKPYPGAFCVYGRDTIFVWKTTVNLSKPAMDAKAGTVVDITPQGEITVKCGVGYIDIVEWTCEARDHLCIAIGERMA